MLPQSKLVENTTKFLQNNLNSEKCGKDWLSSQNLVSSLAPTKFYRSQNQYFPTENIPPLEVDASLLDLSSKGRWLIPVKSLDVWGKRPRNLVVINSYADLFSSAAYLCLQQQSMSVTALSRLLEAVAKSIKHATAMSTILATELFQARHDAALATSKLLLEKSCYELRNAPINAKSLFDIKIKEVATGNYEAQQQRFLASSSTNTNLQQQPKTAYSALTVFKRPRQPKKPSRPKQTQPYRPKSQSHSLSSGTRKDYSKRSDKTKQFRSSKHASSCTKFWNPTLSTDWLTTTRHSSGRKVGPFCGTMGRVNTQKMCPLYHSKWFQDTIQVTSSSFGSSDNMSQSSFLSLGEEIKELLQKRAVEGVQDPGTPGFYSQLFLISK